MWDAIGETCKGLGITINEVDEKAGLRRASQTVSTGGSSSTRSWEFRLRPVGEGAGVALTVLLQDLLALDGGTKLLDAMGEFLGKLEATMQARGLSTAPPAAPSAAPVRRRPSSLAWVGAAFVVFLILVGLSFAGKLSPKPNPAEVAALTPGPKSPPAAEAKPEEKPMTDSASNSIVKISTDKGDLTCEIFDKQTPITAGNFLDLVKSGFYNGLTFHRVEMGFVIQGGDPKGNGTGGPGWSIPLEKAATDLQHERGSLSMARANDPDSAGSQFFVVLAPESAQHLNGQYAVFGKVTQGLDVVDKIAQAMQAQKSQGQAPKLTMTKVTIEKEGPNAAAAIAATKKARIGGHK